jgi:HK97 gp10 family phage protein
MGDYTTVQVKGLKELADALKELPNGIARNVLRGATGAGAAEIRKEAKLKAPVYTGPISAGHPPAGTLKRAVYQSQQRKLSSLVKQVFFVGVRTGKKMKNKSGVSTDPYYWKFVEFGTAKMSARPFLRPAFEAKKLAAIEAIRVYMAERIPKEVAKLKQGPKV